MRPDDRDSDGGDHRWAVQQIDFHCYDVNVTGYNLFVTHGGSATFCVSSNLGCIKRRTWQSHVRMVVE